jgi:hypothetical protein
MTQSVRSVQHVVKCSRSQLSLPGLTDLANFAPIAGIAAPLGAGA